MYILIDNYDSFTYNLFHYFVELGARIDVYRNDAIDTDDILRIAPKGVILSPGPCTPNEAGVCLDFLAKVPDTMPVLGVCLGHQSIGQSAGARVVRAKTVMHGKVSTIHHENTGLFEDLPNPLRATRYHSLTLDPDSMPDSLKVTAKTQDGVIMGVQHRHKPWHGVQFHPESIASEAGHDLLRNFLSKGLS